MCQWATVVLLGVLACIRPAAASPAPEPAEPPAASAAEVDVEVEMPSDGEAPAGSETPTPTDGTADPLLVRAQRIRALLDGTLDVSVEAEALFRFDLADPTWADGAAERLSSVLAELDTPPPTKRRRRRSAPPESPSAEDALRGSLRAFLQLEPAAQAALFEAHALRRTADGELAEAQAAELSSLETRTSQLRAYLDGTLDVATDPAELLALDLLGPQGIGRAPQRRRLWLTGADAPIATSSPVERAQSKLDKLRREFLALLPEQRAALATTHLSRVTEARLATAAAESAASESADAAASAEAKAAEVEEAEKAEAQRTSAAAVAKLGDAEAAVARAEQARLVAEEAARLADTEAKRVVAEERARLLGVIEAQARYDGQLAQRDVERTAAHERVLEWQQSVTVLAQSTRYASEKAEEADPLYDQIREDLAAMRSRLREDLDRLREPGREIPGVGQALDQNLGAGVERGDLDALRKQVTTREAELHEAEAASIWTLAEQARDDIVSLNNSRLALLEMATPALRRSVTSFGGAGVDQAGREFQQISLEVRFFLRSLPRYWDQLSSQLTESPLQVGFAVIKLILVVGAFVWWRRRGTAVLKGVEQSLREGESTSMTRVLLPVIWYLQRIRRPLVMLLMLAGLFYVIDDIEGIPNLDLIWIAAKWVLLGLAGILLVDALAARETLYSASKRDNSELRIHSLRVVGINIIAVGLILALTAAVVGRGAIYSWVLSTCWLLSFPVAVYLISRWKPIIFELVAERPEQTSLTRWITSRETGLGSFPAAAAGAVYLLAMGLVGWGMRQLSGLEATRRLLAYLFRRELAKQAAATQADERFTPIENEAHPFFDPESIPETILDKIAGDELSRVAALASTGAPTLSAVVGERGSGKTVFTRRLAASVTEIPVHTVACPEEGVEALMRALGTVAGDATLRGEALADKVRELGRCVIVIDDLQRLILPAVNGLRGLDEFTAFERAVGGEVSWVVTIGSAAWHFIHRARGDRLSFEQVVQLPRWTEDELGTLIQGQCERANITPSFDGLVVPRGNQEPLPNEGDRTEAGYYRLLWDFSNGNPAVALYAFRESLFRDESQHVVVRLFKEPPAEEVESLSLSVLFVLRTIVQLELALISEIEAATQLPLTDVEDAVRFCSSRKYIERFQGGVRLSWPWYRTITTVLRRQHLLSSL